MTLDFNETILPPFPKVSLSPYNWCKHHFLIPTYQGGEGKRRYRLRCPLCFVPELVGQTGVGVTRAKNNWGEVRVRYAVDFDWFSVQSPHDRLAVVRQMVFRINYEEYLQSDGWRQKRDAVMARSCGKCERCGSPAVHVHHKSYQHLGGEPLTDLEAICRPCHFQEHGRVF